MPTRMSAFVGLVAALFLNSTFAAAQDAEKMSIATLEWPPYTGAELPQGGATTAVARQALAAVGLETDVSYVPWRRAIAMAQNNTSGVVAYFPGYHCRHVDGFIASDPIGNGPLGFAENVEAPLEWESVDDIGERKLAIGTVLGYANTDEFDAKAGTGWVRTIPAKDDITNLKKLLRQRIDAAVIDKMVLSYLLATVPELRSEAETLRFNEKPLEEKTLYMCFNDTEEGRELRTTFNEGLKDIDVDELVDAYFAREFE